MTTPTNKLRALTTPDPKPAEGELLPLPEPDFSLSQFVGNKCVAEAYTAAQLTAYADARGANLHEQLAVTLQAWSEEKARVARVVAERDKANRDAGLMASALDKIRLSSKAEIHELIARAEQAEATSVALQEQVDVLAAQVAELREALRKIEGLLIAATQPKEKT